ncbi:MAG: glycosyltransferase 87 family protein, partial [Chloroflexota bacterium]
MFDLKPEEIEERLRAKLSRIDVGLLSAMVVFLLFMTILLLNNEDQSTPYRYGIGQDFAIFTSRYYEDFYGFYAPWIAPVFFLFARIDYALGYLIWSLTSIASVFFAIRVFNSRALPAILSFQMLMLLYYGQVSGHIAGLLALMWWSLHRDRWVLAGVAFLFAASKPQLG